MHKVSYNKCSRINFIFNVVRCEFVLVLLIGLVLSCFTTRLVGFVGFYVLCFTQGFVWLGLLNKCCVSCWLCFCLWSCNSEELYLENVSWFVFWAKEVALKLLWFCICFGLKLFEELNLSEDLDTKICYVNERTQKKNHQGRGLTSIMRGLFFWPSFLFICFSSFFLSCFFPFSLLKLALCV